MSAASRLQVSGNTGIPRLLGQLTIKSSYSGFQPRPTALRPTTCMDVKTTIAEAANFVIIAGLIIYGFGLFAEYHARGRWAKNMTALLAGMGMMVLAFALIITPTSAALIAKVAQTNASDVFLGISSGLLLAAIAAYGLIAYTRPLRLWHERKIERDLNRELPKIP